MKTIQELVSEAESGMKLKILVFGPQVKKLNRGGRTRALQNKRIEIRNRLEELDHYVRYAEDLVDADLPAPFDDILEQEVLLMSDYDMVVTLVDTAGTIAEAMEISKRPAIAPKASLFIDKNYKDGLVANKLSTGATALGADVSTFIYPDDLRACHLLGAVLNKVSKIQRAKYLS